MEQQPPHFPFSFYLEGGFRYSFQKFALRLHPRHFPSDMEDAQNEFGVDSSIQSIYNHSQMIFTIRQCLKMKANDGCINVTKIFMSKKVKIMRVAQGKVYAGLPP